MAEEAPLIRGNVFWAMVAFGAPYALAMAFHGLFNCVDLLIVGRVGPGAVAAVTIGGIVNMVAMLLFNGIANVMAARAAKAVGENDDHELAKLDATSRRITWACSFGLGIVFVLLARPLVQALDVQDSLVDDASNYLIILSAGSGGMFFLLYQCAMLRSLGQSRQPTMALIGANVLNLGLDILWVFGLWGFPKMGVLGAAWATIASRFLAAIYLGTILQRRRRGWPSSSHCSEQLINILKIGFTHSAQMIVRVVSIYGLLAVATGKFSAEKLKDLSAHFLDGVGVAIRLEMVVLFAALGWGTATASFVGQNLGAKCFDRIQKGVFSALLAALVTCLIGSSIFFWLPEKLLVWIAPKMTLTAMRDGSQYLRIVLLGHPGLIVAIVVSQLLVALNSVWTAVLLDSVLYLFVLLGAAMMVPGTQEIWYSVMAVHLISGPLYMVFFRKRFLAEKQKDLPTSALVR